MPNSFLKRHLQGPGGILELLPIAFPMFLSSMFDMLMMFVDRLYLSHVGVVHQAATMSGGVTSWMLTSFFVGVVGYSSALIAQYYGANQKPHCVRMVRQAFLLALISYPLSLGAHWLLLKANVFSLHSETEIALETKYYWYMGFGSLLSLLRFTFASFFTGIGKTRVILLANTVALAVNVVANWVLIFGHWGCPALELDGAAMGTLLASLSMVSVLAFQFFRRKREPQFQEARHTFLDGEKFRKLLRYGLPQGVENFLCTFCFVFIVSSFHSYGDDVATATTIVFNWDGFSFHPLLGIQVGVTTLVAQALGKNDPALATRTAHSGFKVAILYAGCMILLFLTCTHPLVAFFTPASSGLDYTQVRAYATPMLRLAGVYLMTDAIMLISGGVLRGAGDTFGSMVLHLCSNLFLGSALLLMVHVFDFPPLKAWSFFVFAGMLSVSPIFLRYKRGRWKKLRIISPQERKE